MSATPFLQLDNDMGYQFLSEYICYQSVPAENKRSNLPFEGPNEKPILQNIGFLGLLYLMAKGLGMYQLAENISRNLSVMSSNSNRSGKLSTGYREFFIAFLPTGDATAVGVECRNQDVEGSMVLLSWTTFRRHGRPWMSLSVVSFRL